MAEYQKFIFSENYSTEADNLKQIQQKKIAEARNLMSNEIESAKKEAFELGFQEGQKQALEKLKAEMDLHTNKIIESINQINSFKPELHKTYENYAIACVRHTAKNMFFKSEELFKDKLLEQSIINAMQNLPFISQLTLKIPQECKVYLEDTGIENKIKEQGISDFRIIEDVSLKSGECLLEWDNSGVFSSKHEAMLKINNAFDSFLENEDLELSENTINERSIAKDNALESSENQTETAIEPEETTPEKTSENIQELNINNTEESEEIDSKADLSKQ